MSAPAVPVVEMAFGDGFATPVASMTWTDVSAYVRKIDGVGIQHGRRDERSVADPNQLRLSLNNTDARFTPGNTGGAYYPDVKIGTPVRVRCQYPAKSEANLLTAANADFESGVGSWTAGGSAPPTLSVSTAQAYNGLQSLLATWGTGGSFPLTQAIVTGLTIGETYTYAPWVYVPTGSPNVQPAVGGGIGPGAATSVKDQWVRLSQTFVATATSHGVQIWPQSSPTAGQVVYVDAVMMVNADTVGVFNTAAGGTYTRFLGFVDEWAVTWPTSTDSMAVTDISATSRLARLGNTAELRSLPQEAILADLPVSYWTLGEPAGSTSAASLGSSDQQLLKGGVGTGVVTFGNANGAPSDGSTGAKFAGGGGQLRTDGAVTFGSAMTWSFIYNGSFSSSSGQQNLLFGEHGDGSIITLALTGTGFPAITLTAKDVGFVNQLQCSYSTVIADGATHHIAFTISGTSMALYLDGVSVDTDSNGSYGGITSNGMKIGRVFGTSSSDYGTVSHVAYYSTALDAAAIAAQSEALLTGFLAETPGARIGRYADFAGIASTERSLEDGELPDLANIDIAGSTALGAMGVVEASEGGVLFDAPEGTLTFHGRAHRYGAASTSLPAGAGGLVQGDFAPVMDRSTLVNDVTVATTDEAVSYRETDAASQAAYGLATDSLEVATVNANEPQARAAWIIGNYAEPANRAPVLTVDLGAATPDQQAAIIALGVGDKVTVTALPSQAESTSLSFFVEGYDEAMTPGGHRLTFNVTPSAAWDAVMIFDTDSWDDGKVWGL